jgi:F-type H+-transporting ATPase subunit delta
MPLSEAHPDALAEIYARSLYELSEAKGGREMVESIDAELEEILELARVNAKFGEFLASKILPVADRAKSIDKIFTGRISDLTVRFLHILNEKGRLYHLPAIGAAYDAVVQKKFGKVEVDVFTAESLSGEDVRDITSQLQKALGREPVVHQYTEPSMLGGVKLQIGDRLIDGSVATQLRRVREQIMQNGAAELRARSERIIDDAGSA